jgi:hypothetical protein
MKLRMMAAVLVAGLGLQGCTPDWATDNASPFIIEIASVTNADGELPILSDVSFPVLNDEAQVTVNVFRKNNNEDLATTPVEHVYLKRYEIRYLRSDGRDREGVDVPFRITGPLNNLRFHTAGPGGAGEVEQVFSLTLVRHQAKLEAPLANLRGGVINENEGNFATLPNGAILTLIAEITIFAETVQGKALKAVGNVQVTFADFPNEEA